MMAVIVGLILLAADDYRVQAVGLCIIAGGAVRLNYMARRRKGGCDG